MISFNRHDYHSVKQAAEVCIDWQNDGKEAFTALIEILFERKIINTADLENLFKAKHNPYGGAGHGGWEYQGARLPHYAFTQTGNTK